uniref:Headcase N-terminal domain-containing protein n=1 Tax=Panagrolaimus davidi TaxID=227884 RepID=A0A914PIN7_9BILA
MRHQQKNKEIAHAKKQMKEGNGGGGKSNTKEEDGIIRQKNGEIVCCIPFLPCAKPGHPIPESLEDGVKLSCTNPDCIFSKHLVHIDCFRSLETNLMKLLTSQGYRYCRREGILLTQEMLWEPRGLALLQKNLKCECGKGKMRRDDEAWAKRQALVEPPTEEKEKKKHKPAAAALPTLQVTVKKGAPPPPNFHKLNTHYASSHSPTRSDAYVEDKYGPPLSINTRRRNSNSVTSNDSKPSNIVIPSPTVKKPTAGYIPQFSFTTKSDVPVVHEPDVKKPSFPIGYAPIESSFPKLPETTPLPEVKPLISTTVPSKAPEPTPRVWNVVTHSPKPKSIESSVEAQVKNHTIQSEIAANHTVESKPSQVLEKVIKESAPEQKPTAPFSKPKKFVSIEIQTDETSFDQCLTKNQWQNTNYQHPKEFTYDSDSIIPSPVTLAPINYTGSLYGYIGDRRTRNTTSTSGFASISDADFSPLQTSSPVTEEIPSTPAGLVTFLFKNDETCAIEVYQQGRKEKVMNSFGNEWTPLYFSMAERAPEIGEKAQIHHFKVPEFVLYDIFKVIGKPINEIQIDPKWKFKVIENNGIKCFQIQTQKGLCAFPENLIIASFLKSMKAQAESFLKTEICQIYFSSNFDLTDSQKNIFENAALKVGLDILKFYVIDFQ